MKKTYAIYVVSFNDDERRKRMDERFRKNDVYAHYVKPVYTSDPRISQYDINDAERRNWSIFFQHADSWKQFYEETSADYCIVCEDDVYISNQFQEQMPEIIRQFESQSLDILLLSYLWPYDSFNNTYFPLLPSLSSLASETQQEEKEWTIFPKYQFQLRKYPDDLWGAHMYMISRKHAGEMLNRYTDKYAISCDKPFCTDWQFTKWGNRALLYPMIGVEEGEVKTDHIGQSNFHKECTRAHYSSKKFV